MSDIPPQEPRNEPPISEGYVEYPRAFSQYPGVEFRPPTLDLSVLGRAWVLIQQQLNTWIMATLVAGVIFGIVYGCFMMVIFSLGLFGGMASGNRSLGNSAIFLLVGIELIGALVMMLVQVTVISGLYGMALKQLRGESIEIGDMFRLHGQLPQLILSSILTALVSLAAFCMCFFPVIMVQPLLMFTVPLILDRRMNAVDAMKLSFETLKPQMWMALLVYFILGMVMQLGAFACGVGILVTIPIFIMSTALLYRDFFWQPGETDKFVPGQVL